MVKSHFWEVDQNDYIFIVMYIQRVVDLGRWQSMDSKQCCSTFSSLPWKVLISSLILARALSRSMSKEDVWVAEVFVALSSFLFFVTLAAMRRMRRRPMTEMVRTSRSRWESMAVAAGDSGAPWDSVDEGLVG